MLNYQKLILFTFISLMSYTTASLALETEKEAQEYGIVIIPEKTCLKQAQAINASISKHLPKLENIENKWHVTLYHGAFKKDDLSKIKKEIRNLELHQFNLHFTSFYNTDDRWIDWGTEKTNEIQNLHEKIVNIASPYHVRMLDRSRDALPTVIDSKKKQIEKYGVAGVMDQYKPHLSLFYAFPQNISLQTIPALIKDAQYENITCKTDKIAIAKLGYNGNIIKIIDKMYLK